ncbi:pyocin knob domain-containing protein [uncultured Microbacterium sp.]|uniref:pyocin knob domain-containing protein n=1 Tax=uncultured Microbacterium sp. TaxID=191216 RepID=UPI00374A0EE3
MTVVNVTAALTALGGSEPVTSGRITVEYLRGANGEPATRAVGAAVTLPAPIVIAIVDGSPAEPVDVPPTDGTCYARIWVECRVPRDAGSLELPAVAIPATGPVDITALVAVDPESFEPVTTVVTAWQLAVDDVADMRDVVTSKTAHAVEAAADAGTFAGATEFDANRAGQSAFAAGQSAASALGHKNDASTSAGAAAGSATEAQTARTGAETARTGAETAATAAGIARTGAETAQTGATTARTGAETARTGAETAKTAAETARDVALAGQFAGANLGTADLNAITTPGVYVQPGPASATLARNYPVASGAGVLEVFVLSSTARIQRYVIHGGVAGDVRGEYLRRWAGAVWESWRFVAGQRVDQTAGRAIYTWDDVNGREQLIYGDTGRRDITSLISLPAGASLVSGSRVFMQRVGYDVTVWCEEGLEFSGAFNTAPLYTLPNGFDPLVQGDVSPLFTRNGLRQIGVAQTLSSDKSIRVGASEATGVGANTRFRHTFKTASAWPTSLPGTAFGSIPNA